jgi:sarcosine oxidase, subunit delta
MLRIPCPWCGPREEIEFRAGGEAFVRTPGPDADDRAWARFLYFRHNPSGPYTERWVHVHGCRRWFHLVRDTTTHAILAARRVEETEDPS